MRAARVLVPIALGATVVAVAFGVDAARGAARLQPTRGVAVIETNLAYQDGSAAGTGMVIGANGVVLTNNHVIRGATTIRVKTGGRVYSASVVGYDLGDDVAVLKLAHASGLATVQLGSSSSVRRGQSVTAIGNAGGTGTLVSAAGTVTAVGRAITVQDDQGGSEHLKGLIETDANLQPGDSGGPLLDGSGRVVGIDTAASAGFAFRGVSNDGFAIPINRALAIAKQIRAGRASATVHIGATGFLGVSLQPDGAYGGSGPGALVADVVHGGTADRAGMAAGDTLTALDGHAVSSSATLLPILLQKKPGQTISLTWLDEFGQQQSATARLASGPPQ
jgi:S1-C subfamily serine protease